VRRAVSGGETESGGCSLGSPLVTAAGRSERARAAVQPREREPKHETGTRADGGAPRGRPQRAAAAPRGRTDPAAPRPGSAFPPADGGRAGPFRALPWRSGRMSLVLGLLSHTLSRVLRYSGLRRGCHAPRRRAMEQDKALEVYGDCGGAARAARGGTRAGLEAALPRRCGTERGAPRAARSARRWCLRCSPNVLRGARAEEGSAEGGQEG